MAIKKTDIYRSLWDSCDQLRGGMDASLYKDYILTLLFVKYVSDRAGQPDSLIFVPEGCTFEDMRKLRGNKNIGEEIDKIIAQIAEANELSGVIDRAFFNDAEKFGKGEKMVRTLTALINIFSRQELDFSRNRAGGDDILGDAYEYLMRNFATESGKSKGQFYTPAEVSRVLASVAGVERAERVKQSVYDPTCGSGSLLLKAADAAPVSLSVFGQEKDITTRGLAVMNMILHGKETADIRQGDTLSDPEFINSDGSLQTFDFVVANPPFSDKAWADGMNPEADRFNRFADGIPPAKNGDFAFLLHILASMKATGSGAVILPHGVLFRGNKEAELREKVLKRGYIKAIIGLPANLFYGTGIPASVVVLDKSAATFERPVFMIDASRGFIKDGNKNRLRERDIHKITDAFTRQAEIPGYSRLVQFDEIKRNDFNLNIPRYIDGSDPEDLQDIEAHLNGGVPNRDIDLLQDYWNVMPSVRKALFGPNERPGYSDPLVEPEDVRATIRNHSDFAAYRDHVRAILQGWVDANRPLMQAFDQGARPSELIHTIAEDMLTRFAEAPMINQYEAYQRLMSYWQETMQDDVFIIADAGWETAKELREARRETNDKGKSQWVEEADLIVNKVRLVADVIPPTLIVARYFHELQKVSEEAQAKADAIAAEIDELVDEHGGDEGLLSDAVSDTGKLTKGTLKDRIGSGKADAEELAILKQAKKLMDAETAAKKAAKEAEQALIEATFRKYPELTDEEIRTLVVDDKWLADIAELIEVETEARTAELTERVRVLTERYGTTLGKLERELSSASERVKDALVALGYSER